MKKVLIFIGLIVLIFGLLIIKSFLKERLNFNKNNQPTTFNLNKTLMNKKILMVIAFKNFRDEEYFIPKEILEKNGFIIETTSNKKGLALGADGGEVEILKSTQEININNYEGIIFVGGSGMAEELDNLEFQKLAQEFYKQNKLVSAICIAPALLAKAKVLENKKATVWASIMDKSAIKILEENGAIYQNQKVIRDKNIITANGPQAAEEFAKEIVKYFQ
ncbi:MAG: DJ-1/PfpI family protein [Minisyncoccia bacterium]